MYPLFSGDRAKNDQLGVLSKFREPLKWVVIRSSSNQMHASSNLPSTRTKKVGTLVITLYLYLLCVNDECGPLTMSSDDVDSVFFKYRLFKAESARLIVVCKLTLMVIAAYLNRYDLRWFISNCSGNENSLTVYDMLIIKTEKKLGSPNLFRRYDKCNMPPFPQYGAILTLLRVTGTIAIAQQLLNFLTRILLKMFI